MNIRHRQISPYYQRAFTLLELLIALSLFAVLSVIAYGGLRSVIDADRASQKQAQRLARMQTAYAILARDLRQAIDRPIRDAFGDELPALQGQSHQIELSRSGRRNPANLPRSRLQRIAYRFADHKLYRLSWSILDRAQDSAAHEQVLLDELDQFNLSYLAYDDQWRPSWPPAAVNHRQPGRPLPRALQISLENESWGHIEWTFALATPAAHEQQQQP